MSYNVLVIAEDFTKDEFILGPLVARILAEKGRPNANVQVCRRPNPGGIDSCLDSAFIAEEIVPLYPMVHLFVLFVDRDGSATRIQRIDGVEQAVAGGLAENVRLLGEHAWQEVEIFILAGSDLPGDWSWKAVRDDADVKNTYFRQLAELRGTTHLPHMGRKKLMREALTKWQRIKNRCPEDVGRLLQRT